MALSRTVDVWLDALDLLENPRQQHMHRWAKAAVAEISKEWLRRLYSTYAPEDILKSPKRGSGKRERMTSADWEKQGVLRSLGYKVGRDARLHRFRQRLLSEIFTGPIPPLFSRQYLDSWGKPSSSVRLEKIAKAIASFTRNAKRRREPGLEPAINHWESDLRYLHQKYYEHQFSFAWPTTSL